MYDFILADSSDAWSDDNSSNFAALASSSQAVAAISDIRKDIPIHLELASMTDRDYMNSIMQEVHVENSFLRECFMK